VNAKSGTVFINDPVLHVSNNNFDNWVELIDEYQIYEVIRCNRWQFAGMPIYSESCIDGLPNGVKDYSILMEGPLVNLNE
jgi:hypothetical protein